MNVSKWLVRELTDVKHKTWTLRLYPKVQSTWTQDERAYAYQINTNVLTFTSELSTQDRITLLADQLDLRSALDFDIKTIISFIHSKLLSPVNTAAFRVLSYHDSSGQIVANALDGNGELKPADGFTLDPGNRRPSGIEYARVTQNITLQDLDPMDTKQHAITFYVKLNVTLARTYTDEIGASPPYTLHGFLGASDWYNENFISGPSFIDGNQIMRPFLLVKDRHTEVIAVDCLAFERQVASLAYDIGSDYLLRRMFEDLCPSYVLNPNGVIQQMSQKGVSSDGTTAYVKTVQEYFNEAMKLLPSLTTDSNGCFTVNVAQHWYQNLSDEIRNKVEEDPNQRLQQMAVNLHHSHQREYLRRMYASASVAEQSLQHLHEYLTQRDNRATNAYLSIPSPCNMSVAERTLSTRSPKSEKPCWGCGKVGHSWYNRATKSLTCPSRNDPACIARAEANHSKFKSDLKRSKQDMKDEDAKSGATQKSPSFKQMSALKKQATAFLTSMKQFGFESDISEDEQETTRSQSGRNIRDDVTTTGQPEAKKPKISTDGCVPSHVICCYHTKGVQPRLKKFPIPIAHGLPHIEVPIGSVTTGTVFNLICLYDTGAAMNMGNMQFHLALAERYPQCVKQIYNQNEIEYQDIVFSGAISGGSKEDWTSRITKVIEYYIPASHVSQEGGLSLMIALGEGLGINTLMGLPTIDSVGMVLDGDVVRTKEWDIPPFRVLRKMPMLGITANTSKVSQSAPLTDLPSQSKVQHATSSSSQPYSPGGTFPKYKYYDTDDSDRPDRESKGLPGSREDQETDYFTADSRSFADASDATDSSSFMSNVDKATRVTDETSTYSGTTLPEKRLRFEESLASVGSATIATTNTRPILIPRYTKRKKTSRFTEWTLPDMTDDLDYMFFDGKTVQEIRQTPSSLLPTLDPQFDVKFDPAKDSAELSRNLKLDDSLPAHQREAIIALVKEYWCVFREGGVPTPVQNFQMDIDTGTNTPIVAKGRRFGMAETPEMERHIDALRRIGLIVEDFDSPWLAWPILAPKPHQEDVVDVSKLVWRFCINYVALNSVTKPVAYPIPRCDDAVMFGFGTAVAFALLDAYSGYHQIQLTDSASKKTAFSAPNGAKYRYTCMPFGLRNAPAIFVMIMYTLRAAWISRLKTKDFVVDRNNDSRIIIDDIFTFAESFDKLIMILREIAEVARHYRLSFKLSKSRFLLQKVEFVGVDVGITGNMPARSKFGLLTSWPTPSTVRDIASFIGFILFYSRWIPFFEYRISRLRDLLKSHPMQYRLTSEDLSQETLAEIEDMKQAILKYPILRRADHRKRFYLKADFSSVGMGWVLCQPGDDPESIEAMTAEDNGGACKFEMSVSGKLRLHPIAFGGRRCVGNEVHFHSYPGEATAAAFAISKNRHFLWGRPFTLITDCYALLWILSYKEDNAALRRLQMGLLGMWFTVVHRVNKLNADPDYWSRLSADIHFDPLLSQYMTYCKLIENKHAAPTSSVMTGDQLPGRRRHQRSETSGVNSSSEQPCSVQLARIEPCAEDGNDRYQFEHIPVIFTTEQSPRAEKPYPSYHRDCGSVAWELSKFTWVAYGFGSGHMISSIKKLNLPFVIPVAVDTNAVGRSMWKDVGKVQCVLDGAVALLRKLHDPNPPMKTVHGYWITSPYLQSPYEQRAFLRLQLDIIRQLDIHFNLQFSVLQVSSMYAGSVLRHYQEELLGWDSQTTVCSYPLYGDSVDDSCVLVISVNRRTVPSTVRCSTLQLDHPVRVPAPMAKFINVTYNEACYCTATLPLDPSTPYIFRDEHQTSTSQSSHRVIGYLSTKDVSSNGGREGRVCDIDFLCPSVGVNSPYAIFGNLFGISFDGAEQGVRHIRGVSIYELLRMYHLDDDIVYQYAVRLTNTPTYDGLVTGVPGLTSEYIFSSILQDLISIRNENTMSISLDDELDGHKVAATVLTGFTSLPMPDDDIWLKAYAKDRECVQLLRMVLVPSLRTKRVETDKVHYAYRQPLRQGYIQQENGILYMMDPIPNSTQLLKLQIVPESLRNTVFTAFHVNPLGGHLSAYYTVSKLRGRYFWPYMYKYVVRMIRRCAACLANNASSRCRSELVYSFPVDAPFKVIHADVYLPGDTQSYDGARGFMIVMDHMSSFVIMEPLSGSLNSSAFAKAIGKVMLTFGLAHTCVVDADSKFMAEFVETMAILKIKLHPLSRGNHDGMSVERFNRYLNAALTIFLSDRDSKAAFVEGAYMSAYAWNSAPVVGTDIARSLVAIGREFHFPLDYSVASARSFSQSVSPKAIRTYADNMAGLLVKCQEVYKLLISEHRAMHRELRNSQTPDPFQFHVGDIVLARKQVKSSRLKSRVAKLEYDVNGPWKVVSVQPGGSYDLEDLITGKKIRKKGSELYLCPTHVVPYKPLSGTDLSYGNIDKPLTENPYKSIGIKGYESVRYEQRSTEEEAAPSQNIQSLSTWTVDSTSGDDITMGTVRTQFSFPSLTDLDTEIANDLALQDSAPPSVVDTPAQSFAPMKPAVLGRPPTPAELSASLILHTNRLLFIAFRLPGSQYREWRLVRVELEQSCTSAPECSQTGRYLVTFLICHPDDVGFDCVNQRYWVEYHQRQNNGHMGAQYHLIRPSDVTDAYLLAHNLKPFRAWVNLCHDDVYLHGPFDFAVFSRKSRDRISMKDWQRLLDQKKLNKYDSDGPNRNSSNGTAFYVDVPFHSFHTNRRITRMVASLCSPTPAEEDSSNDVFYALFAAYQDTDTIAN